MARPNIIPIGGKTPPPDRGRLRTAAQVAAELFPAGVTARWVMEHVPNKVRLGHRTVFFYENDVRAWLESQRENVA